MTLQLLRKGRRYTSKMPHLQLRTELQHGEDQTQQEGLHETIINTPSPICSGNVLFLLFIVKYTTHTGECLKYNLPHYWEWG